ncbi:MAG: DMT family transporter [Opitutaceae bacterium]|jgi:drug/metabolite transporter (DMT)-like permease
MIGAIATLLFFACTAVFANRSASLLGPLPANALRLLLAALILGVWAHAVGMGLGGVSLGWFILSGIAGFGVGGVAMFQALPRLGSSLAMLIVQCFTVWVAAGLEWAWLGTRLSSAQLGFAVLTLAGVCIGLAPASWPRLEPAAWKSGIAWALLSATGQGVGAVLSRKAFFVARAAQAMPDAATTAYQRALGGLAVAGLALVIAFWMRKKEGEGAARSSLPAPRQGGLRAAWPWVMGNVLAGPVLGVTCYQWALSTTPAGIVQPVVAASPLATIPLAAWIEGGWPRFRYYPGALLAVLGVAGLYLVR